MTAIERFNRRIAQRSALLETARGELDGFATRAAAIDERMNALEETDVEGLDAVVAEADALDAERETAQGRVDALETEVAELTAQRSALEARTPAIATRATGTARTVQPQAREVALRDGLNGYLRTRDYGELDKRFISSDGSVLIPTDQIFTPSLEVATTYDLSTLVNKVIVSAPSGNYPIQSRAKAVMSTVEELAANPELAKPSFTNIAFSVSTYRGKIEISQESIDDAATDLISLISFDINTQRVNTVNGLVSAALKSFTAKTVTDLDGLKDIINVAIDPAYTVSIIATQSWFNFYDKLKDTTGRYMLQPDLTAPSGKSFEGRPITVVRDTDLGSKAGDKVAFVGDSKAGVTQFERAAISARWIDNDVYGQVLLLGMRTQVKAVDTAAGYLVTVTGA